MAKELEFEEAPGCSKIKAMIHDSQGVARVLTLRVMSVIEDETKPPADRFMCNLAVRCSPEVTK